VTDGPLLDADQIRELLVELGARLDARGVEARLFLVGGAAMALAYGRDRVTRDIDAVFEPKATIYREAEGMASDFGLGNGWLNDAVKGLLPDRVHPVEGSTSFWSPGVYVGVASAEYLFAMKAQAARVEADGEDLRRLAEILGLTDAAEALDLVERFYDPVRLRPTTRLLLEDILSTQGKD
jgi:hypothetical protein